ncbi:hypothetical protein [Micromonospora humi]|uniref:Uncharacterized protein n=1 Tax=Micromonospora humi TaxID=745366 RepID=A0A1C5HES6_9ACTN|nr:hypothetical protein [Micromonospora humi]SCG44522.1 hypothetical protein GA0070213_10323 [Micromonospora humi]
MNTGDVAGQPRRQRVSSVVVASSLLLGLSGLARLAQLAANTVRQDAYQRAHDQVGTSGGFAALPLVFTMGLAVLVALSAVALLVLAVANLAGRNWTRISTWVIGGITLLVAGFGSVLSLLAAVTPTDGGSSPGTTDWDRIDAIARQLVPAWVEPVATIAGFVASPALLVAVVLLALPAANAFYRSRQQVAVPAYPGVAVNW